MSLVSLWNSPASTKAARRNSRPKACVLVKNPGMLHELKAPLTFKPGRFQPPKLAFDSFCNQISLTARMHMTDIITLDCDGSLQSHGTGSGGLKVCAGVCALVCVLFSSLDVLRQAALLYVAYVELMWVAKAWLKLAKRPIPQRLGVMNINYITLTLTFWQSHILFKIV